MLEKSSNGWLQVPFDDVTTVFNNNQAAGKINNGVFNSDPNALIAGGKINTFDSIFNAKAGDNAAQVRLSRICLPAGWLTMFAQSRHSAILWPTVSLQEMGVLGK